MKSKLLALSVASGAFLATGGAALAHHSFAMFDAAHPMEITGTVKEFKFVSPHTILTVTVKGADGVAKDWILEGGAPGMLVRDGMTSKSLQARRRDQGDDQSAAQRRRRRLVPAGPGQVQGRPAGHGPAISAFQGPRAARPHLSFVGQSGRDARVPQQLGGSEMLFRSMIGSVALAAAVIAGPAAAQQPFDQNKYPAFAGQWQRVGPLGAYDNTKPPARGQQAPCTPEYQAIFEANLAEVAQGKSGEDPVHTCIPEGMPRAMTLVLPMEVVITPNTTYILMEYLSMLRRIYTDGRDFPTDEDPSWMGYSIGKWVDEDGDGRFDVLEVETRNLKLPRTFDPSGLPVHKRRRDGHQGALLSRQGEPGHPVRPDHHLSITPSRARGRSCGPCGARRSRSGSNRSAPRATCMS